MAINIRCYPLSNIERWPFH